MNLVNSISDMFPLTHIYCTEKIVKNVTPSLLFGSIFPDIPLTGIIGWNRMKSETEKFSDYIKQNYPDLIDFAEGLLLHENPKGIDRFVHGKNGFAYVKGRQILHYIEKYFTKDQLDTAHSFVEFAVEILLVENTANLQDEIKPVLKWANKNLIQIAEVFSNFFILDYNKSIEVIKEFNYFLSKMDLSSRSQSIQFYTSLTNRLRKTDCSEDVIKNLLERAIDSIKADYIEFLENAIFKCKTNN